MFSGLTNQMSSWIGKKQEGDVPATDEQPVSSPVLEDSTATAPAPVDENISPTKGTAAGSRLDMLGNLGGLGGSVKTQMSSWLGSGIPGLRKGAGAEEGGDDVTATDDATAAAAAEPPLDEKKPDKDDDDNSSEGHVSEEEVTEDKDGQQTIGAVTTKALAGAKSIGGFLFSAVNKAGAKVTEAGAKIKKTVEENSLLGEFNKEQEAFIKEKQGKNGDAAVPPWVGWPNEESLKQECLSLSTDKRNFVRSPPAGVDFQFDYEVSYPIALATLAEDPNLEKMRFELVPKVINEENFWRNYFYRVSLICQASELNSMAQEGGSLDRTSTLDSENPAVDGSAEHSSYDAAAVSNSAAAAADSPLHEFVSDTFSASTQDLEEVQQGMKKLGMDPTPVNAEEEWEKELEAELQEYEVVADDANAKKQKNIMNSWNKKIDDDLEHEEDLK
ncbi:hypothetical protein LSTR_LSTR011414 [Laodelphax striatellus]|uniref:BSD domain-containing protein n=1 Tax=Laodelphax striatellus TaxID=195883 RepID=A0A482WPG8_LAOST|nr:hypothetical protein LSTR_LSTR011414 [Laodelphax striatellus]